MYKIPRDPSWCSECIGPDGHADSMTITEPCEHHRGPDGAPVPYEGRDAYEPTDWVLSVVGERFATGDWSGENDGKRLVYVCQGYDPRQGFWMRRVDRADARRMLTNVSERAIDRTFHRVQMVSGAWILLQEMRRLERALTAQEAEDANVIVELSAPRLEQMGYAAGDALTAEGMAATVPPPYDRYMLRSGKKFAGGKEVAEWPET